MYVSPIPLSLRAAVLRELTFLEYLQVVLSS